MAGDDSAFDRTLQGTTVKSTDVGADGVVLADVEAFAGGEADKGAPIFGALGVVSRPLDADADGAAEALCARASDGLPVMALRDLRIDKSAAVPLAKGTVRLAGYRGATVSIAVAPSGTGSIVTLYVPFEHGADGAPTKAHVLTMDPTSGQEAVVLAAASGAALTLAKDGSTTCRSGNGENFVSITNDGVTFSGDLRMPNSNLVVGDPSLVKDVALAQPAIDALAIIGQIVTLLAGAVNGLAPGTITPVQLTQLSTAIAPYTSGGATCRAPRIQGQPGT